MADSTHTFYAKTSENSIIVNNKKGNHSPITWQRVKPTAASTSL